MSQRAVERTVGKLVTDEGFRKAFYRNAAVASREAGLELTAVELGALLQIPREALVALAARLDDRICCIHVPFPNEEVVS
jgi:hypothetical protein